MEICFHIGLPKCASTWMQSSVFPNISSINYLGRSYEPLEDLDTRAKPPRVKDGIDHALTHLAKSHANEYNKDLVSEEISEQASRDVTNVLSSEQLSEQSNYAISALRIRELFPDAKILILIRAQHTLIESIYLNEVKKGCTRSLSSLLNFQAENKQRIIGEPEIWAPHYNYVKLLGFYRSLFDPNNILMLPIELLDHDKNSFFEKIFEFLNIKQKDKELFLSNVPDLQKQNFSKNKAVVSADSIRSWLLFNKCASFFPAGARVKLQKNHLSKKAKMLNASSAGWKVFTLGKPNSVLGESYTDICNYFAEDNIQLEKELGVDLTRLGYPVKSK